MLVLVLCWIRGHIAVRILRVHIVSIMFESQ